MPLLASLSDEHQRLVAAGFVRREDRVLLRGYINRLVTAPPGDAYGDECWVNDIHLQSSFPASNPSWRREVVDQGLALAGALIPRALDAGETREVQAVISLQSSPTNVDPELDFSVGNFRIVVVRDPGRRDDTRVTLNDFEQPVMVVTSKASTGNPAR